MKPFEIKKILVPIDFSKTSYKALDYATDMAKKCEAEVVLLHVAEGFMQNAEQGFYLSPLYEKDYEINITKQSTDHLSELTERIKKKGITKISARSTIGKTHQEILDACKKIKADIIIMGTHGISGVREFFIGSNTFRVIRDAKCPVLSVQGHSKNPGFKTILLPFRSKPHSREKVIYAIDMAKIYGAAIQVLGFDTEFTDKHKRVVELEAAQIKNLAKERNVPCKTKVISKVYLADEVLKYAKKVEADLIIIMSDLDKMDITEYFTGPFSQQIVNHSTIPVLSIHPKFNTDTIDLRFY